MFSIALMGCQEVCESIIGMFLDIASKTNDGIKLCKNMVNFGNIKNYTVKVDHMKSVTLP